MKKSFFIFLSLCLCLGVHADIFTVRFGKGDNCTGYNICTVTTIPSKEYNDVLTEITLTKSKHVQFVILRKDLNDRAYLKFFSTGYIVMDGDFVLPKEVCESLKVESYTIHSGRYEIKEDNEKYTVVF